MKLNKTNLLLGVALIAPMAMLPMQAIAQNSEPESRSRYEIDEVVTTARRVEEGLQEAPIAVTALSGLDLENRGALDVIDFADVAPNVSLKSNGSVSGFGAAPRTSIRGIGQSDFVINTDPAVGLYADGVYLGRSIGSVLDLVDVERVEALRGPQGTLFGRNSTGGAINIISKKPEVGDESFGYFTAGIGEDGYYLLRGSANIGLGDNAAFRFSGLKRERDGFIPLLNPNPLYDGLSLGAEDVWGAKAAFRYQPTDSFTLDLDADYSERHDSAAPIVAVALGDLSIGETQVDAGIAPALIGASTSLQGRRFNGELPGGPPLNNTAAFISTNPGAAGCADPTIRDTSSECLGNFYASSRDGSYVTWFDNNGNQIRADDQSLNTYGFSARLDWDLGPVNVKTISSWRGFDSSFLNGSPAPIYVATNDNVLFEQDQMSHEITFSGNFGERFDWLAGAFYQEEDGREIVEVRYPLTPPPSSRFGVRLPIANFGDRNVDNSSKAVYGQLATSITDQLELTLGARYTEETKEVFVDQSTFVNVDSPLTATVVRLEAPERKADEVNFLANLSYEATDDILLYGQFSNGFRNGGFPARTPGGFSPDDFVNLTYDEEFVDSYELGFKSTFLDGDLRLNAAAFFADYTDQQINATAFIPIIGNAVNTIANVGDSEIKGFELEGNYLATDNLRFDFSLGYLDSELTSINPDDEGNRQFIINNGNNLQRTITEDSGVELPFAPELQLNIGANYSFFLGNGAEIRNRADLFYEAEQFASIANYDTELIPSSTRVNYNATYIPDDSKWEFTVGARNLFDEEIVSNISIDASPRAARYEVLARGREAYVQLKINFGQ